MYKTIDFWFDFASPYAFLSAKRIAELAIDHGVTVRWRPFLLGPTFRAQGLTTSPFVANPAKGRYMVRDVRRIAATRGHKLVMSDPFPQSSLRAARVALALDEAAGATAVARFSSAVFEAQFEGGQALDDQLMLTRSSAGLTPCPTDVLTRSVSPEIKARLKAETETASILGIFGVPTFVTLDSELFWGDDRLSMALEHAATL
jgi:2-hydroxychromene-2-carboxylate isomerase